MTRRPDTDPLAAETRRLIATHLHELKQLLPGLDDACDPEGPLLEALGTGYEVYIRRALDTARRHPEILPADFDLDSLEADVGLYFALQDAQLQLESLTALIRRRMAFAGSDAVLASSEVLGLAEQAGLEDAREARDMTTVSGRRRARQRRLDGDPEGSGGPPPGTALN